MQSQNRFHITVLGSGTSTGIPLIGCSCAICHSKEAKNKRLRTSIYLQTKTGKRILVDTTPDLRTQLLSYEIQKIDGVIITHAHADHLHGIDDLRPLSFPPSPPIPLYTFPSTCSIIKKRFPYIFSNKTTSIPRLDVISVKEGSYRVLGDDFFFFNLPHGSGKTLGFIYEKFAYLVDCHAIPLEVVEILRERHLELLIIDCVRRAPHATHLHVEKAFEYIKAIAPQRAGLIHISHDLEHHALTKEANSFFDFQVFPLYDGQTLSVGHL